MITINGKEYQVSGDKRLIDFLRDDLNLTSVKEGCSTGACGTCMVLIDGKPRQACTQKLAKLDGSTILTVDGLSDREKDVYVYAFSEVGAVQCGFCIPGMVISAKGLLDVNPNPSEDEIRQAINRNICRCTGYVKIIEGIQLAAELLQSDKALPQADQHPKLASTFHRIDAKDKILGTGKFSDDLKVEGQIYAKALRTKYPRARILKIDIERAQAHPDTVKIALAEDVPFNKHGHLFPDWDVMIKQGDITRYLGDAVAIVAATKKESLDEILDLIEVEYEELEVMDTPFKSLRSDAPLIHPNGNILRREVLRMGNVDVALRESKHVVTRKYFTNHQEHAFMEPESALAVPYGEGVEVFTASQSIFDEQREIARMLQLENEQVRTHSMLVGGGFGGKEDMSVQHHAALMAWLTKKPVRVTLSRAESMVIHPKKHPAHIEMTTACDENGKLTAMRATVITDTGAYASLGGPVLQRLCTHAAGPYNYQNVDVIGMAVLTNNPPCGAFRGFGVSQSIFATESNLNLLAKEVGISPWEIRYRNAIRPGQVLPNGQIADDSAGLVECLKAAKDIYESHPRAGIAAGWKNSGLGVGIPDTSRVNLLIEDGKVYLQTSAACMGQGMATVSHQVLIETTGLPSELIINEPPDSHRTPNAGTTTASRQTLFTGEATRLAGEKLKAALDAVDGDLTKLEGENYYAEFLGVTDPMGSSKEHPVSHVNYSYAVQVCLLDEDLMVEKIVSINDIGQVINLPSAEGQVEGGAIMSFGWALTEDFQLEGGHVKSKYATLGIPRAKQSPPVEAIFVRGPGTAPQAYGAKGVGELSVIPTVPAIAGAYFGVDGIERNSLPLQDTPYTKKK